MIWSIILINFLGSTLISVLVDYEIIRRRWIWVSYCMFLVGVVVVFYAGIMGGCGYHVD